MVLRWEHVVLHAVDAVALGWWWADALGWTVVNETPEDFEIQPVQGQSPSIVFEPASEPKTAQNRLHLDLRPDDQDAEVARLLARGATRVNIGQGADVPWVVLADPEGNEFCVLGERRV